MYFSLTRLLISLFCLICANTPLTVVAQTPDHTNYTGIITENIRGNIIQFSDDGHAFSDDNLTRLETIKKIIDKATELSGIQYHAGGISPSTGFDCSGFVRYVFSDVANISLPASARNIAKIGQVIDKNNLQPGDLVFFNTLKTAFSHVAIYIGNNEFIHAPSKGNVVRIDSLDSRYWASHFNGAKRIGLD